MKKTDEEMALMASLNITCEQSTVYRYKQYHYNKLQDAINFAKLDSSQQNANQHSKDHD